METYYWNLFKIWKISSLWRYESKMVVIFTRYKAAIHLKSRNYFGTKRFKKALESLS
jgi:hypothetical protein